LTYSFIIREIGSRKKPLNFSEGHSGRGEASEKRLPSGQRPAHNLATQPQLKLEAAAVHGLQHKRPCKLPVWPGFFEPLGASCGFLEHL